MTNVQTEVPQYLLRLWGRDEDAVTKLRPPDAREAEDDGTLCYWFATREERNWFMDAIPEGYLVVRSATDPGPDNHGEAIETRARTCADVVLRLPDGTEHAYTQSFGYGYAEHAVRYMYEDGNYACDCNRQLFLIQECGLDMDEDAVTCGDTIALVSLTVRKVPLP